ncbi:Serine/threonine-protein kinase HT1 [Platanthera guangdongensis]|uniref:Serine/threonine-protein kinase HT1 n=1 Tax=Platanthera guangdongensis TaxID=2320717 RepID=A0ABR2LYU7_9ASPA
MDEEYKSWVTGTSFSRTVCHRLDFSTLPPLRISTQFDHEKGSKPKNPIPDYSNLSTVISLREERGFNTAKHNKNLINLLCSSFSSSSPSPQSDFRSLQSSMGSNSSTSALHHEHDDLRSNSKSKRRSISPLPTTISSDSFKETQSETKGFSSPSPSRKTSVSKVLGRVLSRGIHENDSFAASPSAPQGSHLLHFLERVSSVKIGRRRETTWGMYFGHGIGKVASANIADEWMVDLSQLYLGFRFALGAHSRLYHGVYKDKNVAVKIIQSPDEEDDENGMMAARLEKQYSREVNFLSQLQHRNVIKLVAACKNPPVYCIITEYLSGGSLRAFLHKLEHESLALQKVISIALDIARGMEYIHSQGLIHRDLKPENILFDEELCVKIADFGIACEEACSDRLSEDPGTYRWMAPEMIKHQHCGRKVDVYSFGLVLWEMVTGRVPYEDMTQIQAAFAVVDKNSRPTIPPDCPATLRSLMEKCWASVPGKRPDFWQIVKVLEQFESNFARGVVPDQFQNQTSCEQKKDLRHWIQKFKRHLIGPKVF